MVCRDSVLPREFLVNTQPDLASQARKLRERLGLTQEKFAQKVGVTFSSVNHWENGKRTPQPFLVRRLVEMKEELDAEQKRSPKRKSSE